MVRYTVAEVAEITNRSLHEIRVWCAERDVEVSDGVFLLTEDQLYLFASDHGLEIELTDSGDPEEEDLAEGEEAEEPEEAEEEGEADDDDDDNDNDGGADECAD